MITPVWQRDPKWKDVVFGQLQNRPVTIGDDGCNLCSICCALQNFNIQVTPPELAVKLRAVKNPDGTEGGLDPQGNVIWNGLTKVYPELEFLGRDYVEPPEFNAQLITSARAYELWWKRANLGVYSMLRVKLGANPQKANHFVLGLSNERIMDPWTGEIGSFREQYGNPMTQIFGIAAYYANPVEAKEAWLLPMLYKAGEMKKSTTSVETLRLYGKEIFESLVD